MITISITWYLFCLGYSLSQIDEFDFWVCVTVAIFCPIVVPFGLGGDLANYFNKNNK